MLLALITIVVVIVLIIMGFVKFHPVFGKRPSKQRVKTFQNYPSFENGKFVNQIPTNMSTDFKSMLPTMIEFIKGSPGRQPKKPIVIEQLDITRLHGENGTKITWFGHSAFLLESFGKTILIDPMFGKAPTPVPIFGNKRYSKELPFEIDQLPEIDSVIFSHDHYDHLDFGTIRKLKNRVKEFVVPLGVAGHLERWGVPAQKIKECYWWEEVRSAGLNLVCAPSRHFSGRSLSDRNATLWCSWVIQTHDSKIYFSADSGYGPHFKEIGEKYGPFDVTLMECGQYHENWASIHMLPEETVQAHLDVRGKVLIPIHWGAFTLSLHDWTDPIERVKKAAKEKGVQLSTPKIGETVSINENHYPTEIWWKG